MENDSSLRDGNGLILETDFYFFNGVTQASLCYVVVSKDRKSFSVEDPVGGFLPITNFQEAARNLYHIGGRDTVSINARFALSKVEQLASQKS